MKYYRLIAYHSESFSPEETAFFNLAKGFIYNTAKENLSSIENLGNKAKNLLIAQAFGMPVPPFFVIRGEQIAAGNLFSEYPDSMPLPFPVFVRSAPPISMPGCMVSIPDITNFGELRAAINEVFASWNSPKALSFRKRNKLSSTIFPDVIVQKIIYGNQNIDAGSGVLFTRNPQNGNKELVGKIAWGSMGDKVVQIYKNVQLSNLQEIWEKYPFLKNEFATIAEQLENLFLGIQDVEFVIANQKLWILQTRKLKVHPSIEAKVTLELAQNNKINRFDLVSKILELPSKEYAINSRNNLQLMDQGISFSPGIAQGYGQTSLKQPGQIIFLSAEPSDEMLIALIEGKIQGLVTTYGHEFSHEAVLCRGLDIPYISIAGDLQKLANQSLVIDGNAGKVYLGAAFESSNTRLEPLTLSGLTPEYIKSQVRYTHREFTLDSIIEHALLIVEISEAQSFTTEILQKNFYAHFLHQVIVEKALNIGISRGNIETLIEIGTTAALEKKTAEEILKAISEESLEQQTSNPFNHANLIFLKKDEAIQFFKFKNVPEEHIKTKTFSDPKNKIYISQVPGDQGRIMYRQEAELDKRIEEADQFAQKYSGVILVSRDFHSQIAADDLEKCKHFHAQGYEVTVMVYYDDRVEPTGSTKI